MLFYHLSSSRPQEGRPFHSYHHAGYGLAAEGLSWPVPECRLEEARLILSEHVSGVCSGGSHPENRPFPAIDLDVLQRIRKDLPCPHEPPCGIVDALAEEAICRLPGLACARSLEELLSLAGEWDLLIATDVDEAEVKEIWVWKVEGREVGEIHDGVVVEVERVVEVVPLIRIVRSTGRYRRLRTMR